MTFAESVNFFVSMTHFGYFVKQIHSLFAGSTAEAKARH
jgi:hypothetical protein